MSSFHIFVAGLMIACATTTGCASEAEEDDTEEAEGAQVVGGQKTGASSGARDIVVNEINALGSTEWLEIGNKGKVRFDLTNYAIADSDASGEPRLDRAIRFPPGTSIDAGGTILIVLDKEGQTVGPHGPSECVDGASRCFFAGFAISAERGEAVHFVGPDGARISSFAYPTALTANLTDEATTRTVCRLPDLTGPFALCTKTPGARNRR
jgi:hypothetical protein